MLMDEEHKAFSIKEPINQGYHHKTKSQGTEIKPRDGTKKRIGPQRKEMNLRRAIGIPSINQVWRLNSLGSFGEPQRIFPKNSRCQKAIGT